MKSSRSKSKIFEILDKLEMVPVHRLRKDESSRSTYRDEESSRIFWKILREDDRSSNFFCSEIALLLAVSLV